MRISLGLAALLTGTLTTHAYGSCRHGVEHQLEGLGIQHTFSLLPWERLSATSPSQHWPMPCLYSLPPFPPSRCPRRHPPTQAAAFLVYG